MPYPNEALAAAAEALVEWNLSDEEVANLCADLPGEFPHFRQQAEGEDTRWNEAFRAKFPDEASHA